MAYKDKKDELKYYREYYLKNKIKKLAYRKEYYSKNRIKLISKMKEYYSKYSKNNKEKISIKNKKWYLKIKNDRLEYWRIYDKNMRKTNENYIIKKRLRSRLNQEKIRYLNKGKCFFSSKYGIDYASIMEHLKPFPQDISKYHIDHIKPLCSFDLTDPQKVRNAFAPENHQWLLAGENLKKGGR